jgi:hypothetical protein
VLGERTAKQQLRAYLGVVEAAAKFTDDGYIEGQVHIKNSGQTPAYDVRSWNYASVRPYPDTKLIPPPPPEKMPRAVAMISSQEKHIVVALKVPVPSDVLDKLKTPNFAYFLEGEVRYRDIFEEEHCASYRLFYGGPAGTRTTKDNNGVTLGYMVPDSIGNGEGCQPRPNPN